MNEFLEVLPRYLLRVPPDREINFGTDVLPNMKTISISQYRMTLAKLKEHMKNLPEKKFIRPSV